MGEFCSTDSVSVDMETIYLGGKVLILALIHRISSPMCNLIQFYFFWGKFWFLLLFLNFWGFNIGLTDLVVILLGFF